VELHIIILTAGKGTRMCSKIPKVLHKLGGITLLEHILITSKNLFPNKLHIVYSDQNSIIQNYFKDENINWVKQNEILGTGHAIMQVLPYLSTNKSIRVLILYGDIPMINISTLRILLEKSAKYDLGLITANFADPSGLGRIIRDDIGNIIEIIEHKNTNCIQRNITEINTGIVVTSSQILQEYLPKLQNNNNQLEYHFTDIISMMVKDQKSIYCFPVQDEFEVSGINTRNQLSTLERIYQNRISFDLMSKGVTILDPNRFDVRGKLIICTDVIIDINVICEGTIEIGNDTIIGPNNFLKDVKIGKNVIIKANCVIENAIIGDNCIIGPFARIRPNTFIESDVKIGNFTELKNTKIGKKSKCNHMSYLGDASIGENINIGAGTITCNYDGFNKYQTIIKNNAFIGANTTLIAPLKIGGNAYIGAGSVITKDTPDNKLTLARARQITLKEWKKNKQKNS